MIIRICDDWLNGPLVPEAKFNEKKKKKKKKIFISNTSQSIIQMCNALEVKIFKFLFDF